MFDFLRKYRKKRLIKRLTQGKNIFIDPSVEISGADKLHLADHIHVQPGCKLLALGGGISIGEGCILAHDVQIMARNHVYDADDLAMIPYDTRFVEKPVSIGDFCWIGARVTVLPGVTVGRGCVIGAGAVVTKDLPDYAVCGGNPAGVLKFRNAEQFEALCAQDKGYIKATKHYR